MKTGTSAWLVVCIISILLCSRIFSQNAGDSVFTGIQVHTIKLQFSQPDYWDSLKIYYDQGNEQLMEANAVIDGVEYPSVGVRLKGNSSYTYPTNKKSFKIDFDEYVDDQKWDGMKGVHLNNCWGDPTYMREKIHLDFCRDLGMAAPRANYTQLFLNDSLWGFYSLVEHVDKTFLKTHFKNKSGDLFKAVDGFDEEGKAILSDFVWYGAEDSLYTDHYELKTDGSTTAWPALIAFIDTLNNGVDKETAISSLFNIETYFKILSADVLFANLDSYLNSGRNFYFYFIPSAKAEWVVWDVGLSFGAYSEGVSKVESMNVMYGSTSADRPLLKEIMNIQTLKNAYLKILDSLFTNYFTTERLFAHIDSVADVIRSYVNSDPQKMYTLLQFETNITSDIDAEGGGGTRKPGLKSFITARSASVKSQLNSLLSDVPEYSAANDIPASYVLSQNYPNPFNPTTVIGYRLPVAGIVTLKIYDLLGREVATVVNEYKQAGSYNIQLSINHLSAARHGYRLTSGVYLYRLTAGNYSSTKKMILLK